MRIHRIHQQQARRIWHLCLRDGRPSESLLRAAMDHLTTRRPRGFLPVLYGLRRRLELLQRLTTVRITAADPLTGSLRHDVEQAVRQRFPWATRIIHEDDPGLLAGIRVQAGYDVIDDSLLRKINRLNQKLQT
jgi:F0F1-type ATP synthase delta subunit